MNFEFLIFNLSLYKFCSDVRYLDNEVFLKKAFTDKTVLKAFIHAI